MNVIDKFLQENSIGEFSHSPMLYVDCYPNDDGNIPHFHVYDIDKRLDTCLEIEDNRYFRHGQHKSIISDGKVRKLLTKFLRSKPTNMNGLKFKTNWHWIRSIWNASSQRLKVSESIQTSPDYSTIKLEIKNDPRLKNLKRKR